MSDAETFYCVACRYAYPIEKAAHIAAGVHRDGEAVGFCFLCVRELRRETQSVPAPEFQEFEEEPGVQAAGA